MAMVMIWGHRAAVYLFYSVILVPADSSKLTYICIHRGALVFLSFAFKVYASALVKALAKIFREILRDFFQIQSKYSSRYLHNIIPHKHMRGVSQG